MDQTVPVATHVQPALVFWIVFWTPRVISNCDQCQWHTGQLEPKISWCIPNHSKHNMPYLKLHMHLHPSSPWFTTSRLIQEISFPMSCFAIPTGLCNLMAVVLGRLHPHWCWSTWYLWDTNSAAVGRAQCSGTLSATHVQRRWAKKKSRRVRAPTSISKVIWLVVSNPSW